MRTGIHRNCFWMKALFETGPMFPRHLSGQEKSVFDHRLRALETATEAVSLVTLVNIFTRLQEEWPFSFLHSHADAEDLWCLRFIYKVLP